MTIRAVFLDMGGTIEMLSYDDELRLAATAGLRQSMLEQNLDPGLPAEALYPHILAGLKRYTAWKEASLVELPSAKIWQEYLLAGLGLPSERLAEISEELAFFFEGHFFRRTMRPEVPEVLDALRARGLKLGIISNVMSHGLVPHQLQQFGIADYFDPVVLSSQFGRRKPDPTIFWHAARLAGVSPADCAYVGDTVSRDVQGARLAGYGLAIRIRHTPLDSQGDQMAVPDYTISNMIELLDILESEMQPPTQAHGPNQTARKPIKALLFDAGDLLYHRPHRGERLAAFLSERELDWNSVSEAEKKALRTQAMTGQISGQAYRDQVLERLGLQDEKDLAQGRRLLEEESNEVVFFDGVRETLLALKARGFMLGVVTDTYHPASVKLGWFARIGIDHVWDAFVSSQEVGVRKPDPRIYHAALEELSIEPAEAIFVGHKASELRGARAVGMATVAFNYDRDAEADAYIEHFGDLLTVPFLANPEL